MSNFSELLTQFRLRQKLTKNALAQIIQKTPTLIGAFEKTVKGHAAKSPTYDLFLKLCEALNLNDKEKLQFAVSAVNLRLSDDNRQYIDYINKNKSNMDLNFLSDESIKNMIKERFEPLFNDKKAVELLYDTDVLNVLKKIHDLPKDKRNKKINLIAQILDD